MINFAVAHDYLDKNPFLIHKPKVVKKEVLYLSKLELSRLHNKKLSNKRLEEVRDCFVFCCYTGLAFKEISNLRKEHIVQGNDAKNWIRMKRQKTDKSISIPLLPVAQNLLDNYEGELEGGKVLLGESNSHFNAYLKEIAALCKSKQISFTVLLEKPLPPLYYF